VLDGEHFVVIYKDTMSSRRLFLPLLLVCASPVFAQQDGPAVNASAILRDLDMTELRQKQAAQSAQQSVIAKLQSAMSSGSAAVSLYSDAVKSTVFQGKKDDARAFEDWRGQKAELLRSKEMQTALQLYLKYLVLSLQRKDAKSPATFVNPSLLYARELAAAGPYFVTTGKAEGKGGGRRGGGKKNAPEAGNPGAKPDEIKGILDASVGDTPIAKWLGIGPMLPEGKNWELRAGDLSGILEKNVRPYFREQKNPQLIETWDLEMQLQADLVTAGQLDYDADQFNTVTRPIMQFAKANDYSTLGMNNHAINDIYTLIKTYPQHPDFPKWVQRIRELLKPMVPAPAPAATTPVPTATAAPTP